MAGHHHHHHHHGHDDKSLTVIEEPLDPAQQSLSDALRVSFKALKLVMVVLVALFLVNGIVFNVDEREVVVLLRFGEATGKPLQSGLHFSWPYPIEERVKVSTVAQPLKVDDFWLKLRDSEKATDLNQLTRNGGIDPRREGALLTGDRALMHLSFTAQYQVRDDDTSPRKYVKNVSDAPALLRAVLRSAAVAEAARSTAEEVLKDPSPTNTLMQRIHKRAQLRLDALETGIELTKSTAEGRYYPLQVNADFNNVSSASSMKTQMIRDAMKEKEEKLQEAAGSAWEPLAEALSRLDQAENDTERDEIITEIDKILEEDATGQAGKKIQEAKSLRERILEDTQANVRQFELLLAQYRENPKLVRTAMRKDVLDRLWAEPGVTRMVLPPGESMNMFLFNKDPLDQRKDDEARIKEKAGKR